jgi:hypothetical protein
MIFSKFRRLNTIDFANYNHQRVKPKCNNVKAIFNTQKLFDLKWHFKVTSMNNVARNGIFVARNENSKFESEN